MILIGLGAAFGTLALVIVAELIRLSFGADSIFEERPVPTWMAVISSILGTTLISVGVVIRRASSRKETRLLEQL